MQKRSPPAGLLLAVLVVFPAFSSLVRAVSFRTHLKNEAAILAAEPHPPQESPGPQVFGPSFTPLIDMREATYLGFEGGLYPVAMNEMPVEHAQEGLARAAAIRPLDVNGLPDPAGRIVLLSIGMSNAAAEFCTVDPEETGCSSWSFMGQAALSPALNRQSLAILNGARGGAVAQAWLTPDSYDYDRIRDEVLAPEGLTELQVQAAWVKLANAGPEISLPDPQADAYFLLASLGSVVRALQVRYPNLQQVFLSSRIYAGYASVPLNPEPYAYEYGFSVKWLIEAQIEQANGGEVDPLAGDLDYDTVAPWLAWGPYLWADGPNPRSDGLTWLPGDFNADGTHPSPSGQEKVASALLAFFSGSPMTTPWFMARGLAFFPVMMSGIEGR